MKVFILTVLIVIFTGCTSCGSTNSKNTAIATDTIADAGIDAG